MSLASAYFTLRRWAVARAAALAALSCFAAMAPSYGQDILKGESVGIHIAMNSSSSASYSVTFKGDDGDVTETITGSGAKEGSIFGQMKVDVTYEIVLTTNQNTQNAKLKMSAPPGWVFEIGVGDDLIERDTFLMGVNSTQTLTVKLSPRGFQSETMQAGECTSLSRTGLNWSVGLGTLINGKSAGMLRLSQSDFDDLSYAASDVMFYAAGPEVHYGLDGGVLDWIYAPQVYVDVVDTDPEDNRYELRFYDHSAVSGYDPDPAGSQSYTINSEIDPYVTYEITKPGEHQMRIKKTVGAKSWYTRMSYASNMWTMHDWTEGAGTEETATLRKVKTSVSGSGNWLYETTEEYGPSDVLSSRTRYSYYKYDWGWELDKKEEGYGSSDARVTDYEYWYSLSNDGAGKYGKLKFVTSPEGGQTYYFYYNDFDKRGLLETVKRPFENQPEGDMTFYEYEEDVSGNKYVVKLEKRVIVQNAIWYEVARTEYVYANHTLNGFDVRETKVKEYLKGANSSGTEGVDFQTTVYRSYREDLNATSGTLGDGADNDGRATWFFRRGMPVSVTRPDGTRTTYGYYYNGVNAYCMNVMNGLASQPSGTNWFKVDEWFLSDERDEIWHVDGKTTMSSRNMRPNGLVWLTATEVADSSDASIPLERVWTSKWHYDSTSRLTRRTQITWQSNYVNAGSGTERTIYEATYEDLRLKQTKDETGATTSYESYDSLGRLVRKDEVGSSEGIATVQNHFGYDGSNRLVLQEVRDSSGANPISTDWTYDYAGRVTSMTDPSGNVTSRSYPSSSVQDSVTTTYPDGSSLTETVYDDGTLASRTGSAASPLYVHRRVDTTRGGDNRWIETWTAANSFSFSTSASDMVGWSKTFHDKAGRLRETVEPTTDANLHRLVERSYNAKGQLETIATKSRNVSTSTTSRLIDDYRYEYDVFGQLEYEGLDVGNEVGTVVDGELVETLAGNDKSRLLKYELSYIEDSSLEWWSSLKTYAYPGTSAVKISEEKFKLSAVSGTLAKTESFDQFGNKATTAVTVDRTDAKVTSKTELSVGATNVAEDIYKNNLLTSSKGLDGVTRTFTYDSLRRLKTENGPASQKATYDYYSGTGLVHKRYRNIDGTDENTDIYTYLDGYLSQHQRLNKIAGVSSTETIYYDYDYSAGELVYSEWGNGTYPVTQFFDVYGRLEETQQQRGSSSYAVTRYVYDPQTGLLAKRRQMNGSSSSDDEEYQYDGLGRRSRLTHASDKYTVYSYYAGTGDLKKEDHFNAGGGNSSTPDVTYDEYDRMGRLTKVTDATGQRTIAYDSNVHDGMSLTKEDLNDTFYGLNNDVTYSYEDSTKMEGRYKGLTYDGKYWGFQYDGVTGRISKVDATFGSGAAIGFDVGYTADRLTSVAESGGDYTHVRSFDAYSRGISSVETLYGTSGRAKFQDIGLSWNGQVDAAKLKHDGPASLASKYGSGSDVTMGYTYDKVGQLKTFNTTRTSGTEASYSYDYAGNRTDAVDYGNDGTDWLSSGWHNEQKRLLYEYEENPDYDEYDCWYYEYYYGEYDEMYCEEYIETETEVQFYDVDGNLTKGISKGDDGTLVWNLTYDANNRVSTMTLDTNLSSGTSPVKLLEFKYDYMGRRVEKVTRSGTSAGSTVVKKRRFVYDGMTLIAEIGGGSGSTWTLSHLRSFYWGPDLSDTVGGAGGAMGLVMIEDYELDATGDSYFASHDHSGNLVGLLDESGNYAAWYEYDPFGNIRASGGAMEDLNPIGFSGQYTDRETNMSYYGFRYYSPEMGRFVNRDPIGEVGGLNLYRFVNNDPVNHVDVWGLTLADVHLFQFPIQALGAATSGNPLGSLGSFGRNGGFAPPSSFGGGSDFGTNVGALFRSGAVSLYGSDGFVYVGKADSTGRLIPTSVFRSNERVPGFEDDTQPTNPGEPEPSDPVGPVNPVDPVTTSLPAFTPARSNQNGAGTLPPGWTQERYDAWVAQGQDNSWMARATSWLADKAPWANNAIANMPWSQSGSDYVAGWGDTLSFGLSNLAREGIGSNGAVNKDSGFYTAGEATGFVHSFAFGGAAGYAKAGAGGVQTARGWSGLRNLGTEFSHWIPARMRGPSSLWNGNVVSTFKHAMSDPFRYRFMPRAWKATNGPMPSRFMQQLNRIPYVYPGAGAGGLFGIGGWFTNETVNGSLND